jgi:hypothetical protein
VGMIMVMIGIVVVHSFIKGKKEAEQNLVENKEKTE